MTTDDEHFFMSLCVICIFSPTHPFFGDMSVEIFYSLMLESFLIIKFRVPFRCSLQTLYQICLSANNFSLSVTCLFIHLTMYFWRVPNFGWVQFTKKLFLIIGKVMNRCCDKEIFVTQGHRDLLLCTLLTVLRSTFRPIIYFELILVCLVWGTGGQIFLKGQIVKILGFVGTQSLS